MRIISVAASVLISASFAMAGSPEREQSGNECARDRIRSAIRKSQRSADDRIGVWSPRRLEASPPRVIAPEGLSGGLWIQYSPDSRFLGLSWRMVLF